MQISRSLIACGAALLCLVSIPARGEDSPEEARMREALRQKMAESKASEAVAPAPSTAPVPSPEAVKPAPVVAKPVKPAPVVAKPVKPAPVVAKPVKPAPSPVIAKPVTAAVPAPVVVDNPTPIATKPDNAAAIALAGEDDPQAARLRQVLREQMERGAVTSAEPATLPNTTAINSSTTVVAAPAPAVLDSAPALPISGTKEQRLATLLQQYKADQITPQQYHEQRSKILAE